MLIPDSFITVFSWPSWLNSGMNLFFFLFSVDLSLDLTALFD